MSLKDCLISVEDAWESRNGAKQQAYLPCLSEMIEFALYFTFGLFSVACLAAIFSSIYSVIIKGNMKSIITIIIGLVFVFPCIALLFFPLSNEWITKFSAAGLISAISLVLIAIMGIIVSTLMNLLKK